MFAPWKLSEISSEDERGSTGVESLLGCGTPGEPGDTGAGDGAPPTAVEGADVGGGVFVLAEVGAVKAAVGGAFVDAVLAAEFVLRTV